jgi:RNA polymerase sigma factor (sigma-70 family)
LQTQSMQTYFEQTMLPHMDAAYNLARWLVGDNQDAEDMVQDSYLKAFKSFGGFHGGDGRAWLLTIVRNTCYTWLQRNQKITTSFDDELDVTGTEAQSSEKLLLEQIDHEMLGQALDELPVEYREVIILRELENLSYKEIAQIARVPLGTVMSRLARGRKRLQQTLSKRMNGD